MKFQCVSKYFILLIFIQIFHFFLSNTYTSIIIPLLSNFPGCKFVSSKIKCVLFDNCKNPFNNLFVA